ncbi:Uncharacterised protein [uncultured archaeon]|nr:Uncharacterised protein [uncultured archaeon]
MAIEKILEQEFSFTWKAKPKIKLKVLCSNCGKKYIVKEKFPSWNQSYIREAKCPNPKCGDVSYIQHDLRYPDKGPEYTPAVVPGKVA